MPRKRTPATRSRPRGESIEDRWLALMRRGELQRVEVKGRAMATTFWGAAWCRNLESYSDFANRLPRGRTYVRQNKVRHLVVAAGEILALVRGTSLYEVTISIAPLPRPAWQAVCRDCAGAIDSLIALLRGQLSDAVMERICRLNGGLFPTPQEIRLACSCPDWAEMCKHVAAVLYGVGARLDRQPELLFRLRGVDEQELIAGAVSGARRPRGGPAADKLLTGVNLAELFGLPLKEPKRGAAAGRKKPARATNRRTR